MSWYESGGFLVVRTPSKDDTSGSRTARMSLWYPDEMRYIGIDVNQTDLMMMRRDISSLLRQMKEERK